MIAGIVSQYDEQHRQFSHYARITGSRTAGGAISKDEITDGTSNTVMLVEACGVDRVWTNPVDVDIDSQPIGVNVPGSTRFHSHSWLSSIEPTLRWPTVLLNPSQRKSTPKY